MTNALIIVGAIFGVLAVTIFIAWLFSMNGKDGAPEMTPEQHADIAIDTLLECLWNDSDYKGFKTRTDIVKWITARRSLVQEAVKRGQIAPKRM